MYTMGARLPQTQPLKSFFEKTPDSVNRKSHVLQQANCRAFYNNLQKLYKKYKFSPDRIFNLDESGLSTVHNPPKVIAGKEQL